MSQSKVKWEDVEKQSRARNETVERLVSSLGLADVFSVAAKGLPKLARRPAKLAKSPHPGTPSRELLDHFTFTTPIRLPEDRPHRAAPVRQGPFHSIEFLMPPFLPGILPSPLPHGGNPPHSHYVAVSDDGFNFFSVIDDDSSQLFDDANLYLPITPRTSGGSLSFRPWIQFNYQRYLQAAGFAEAHSRGRVNSAIYSSAHPRPGAGPLRLEGIAPGAVLWDTRYSSASPNSTGHQHPTDPSDGEGTVWPPSVQVDIGNVNQSRHYFGLVQVEVSSDADGRHLFYASGSRVSLFVTVPWAVVEQSAS
jgi:hypothetical protein